MLTQRCAVAALALLAFVQMAGAVRSDNEDPVMYKGEKLPELPADQKQGLKSDDIKDGFWNANPVYLSGTTNWGKEGLTVKNAGKDESITVSWGHLDVSNYSTLTQAKVKLCFSKESVVDRPWRKFKADVEKSKQCVVKAIDTVKWSEGKKKWTVKSSVPRSIAYLRVFGLDKDDKYLFFADSSIFQINGYDGLEPGITAGSVVLSCLSIAILAGYFAYITFKKSE